MSYSQTNPCAVILTVVTFSLLMTFLHADEVNQSNSKKEDSEFAEITTRHRLNTDRLKFGYKAVAGFTELKDKAGKSTANIFSIAYFREGEIKPEERPVAFVFNGGPGSSSVWLHLGFLGPKRIRMPQNGSGFGAAPYRLTDNPQSLLEVVDLVFIDPVGTGFSHAIGELKDSDFWTVETDALSMADFIERFITKHKRWNSPKYLIGESYGTIRATMLVKNLQEATVGIALSGIVLVAPALDHRHIMGVGTDIPFVTMLPTYAATAWYHNRLKNKPKNFDSFLEDARQFASTEYLTALFEGDSISSTRKKNIAKRLEEFTGLDGTYLMRSNIRINSSRFMRELLRDRELVVGRLDSRLVGKEEENVGEFPTRDPALQRVSPGFIALLNDYLTRSLEVKIDRRYDILNRNAVRGWKRSAEPSGNFEGFLNVVPVLARGMHDNPDMRLFVANGYYDMTTSFFSSEYMFNHSGIDKTRITMKTYKSGHMIYVDDVSFRKFAADVKQFVVERDSKRTSSTSN